MAIVYYYEPMDENDWVTLVFRNRKTLLIHIEDLKLFSKTGLDEMIDIDWVTSPNVCDRDAFIRRDIKTFTLFLDFLSGYGLTRAKDKDPARLVQMLMADNKWYKVPGIEKEINKLAYYQCAELLTDEEMKGVYHTLNVEYQGRNNAMFKKIQKDIEVLEDFIDEMTEEDQFVIKKIEEDAKAWLPYERLSAMHSQLKQMLQYTKFKEDMEARLPYLLMAMINALGFVMLKKPHPDAENNIKHVIRNEPGLIKDLYKNLTFLRLRSFTQVILSSVSQLFIPPKP